MVTCVPTSTASVTIRKETRLDGHRERVFDLSWSPTGPCRLASVGQTCGIVWSLGVDGSVTSRTRLPGSELMRVCWHPDGDKVLTGSSEGKISICDATDGSMLSALQASTDHEVYGRAMLSRDGLLAAGAGEHVQLWDLNRETKFAQAQLAMDAENGVIFGGPDRNPERKAFLFSLAARGRALCAALSDGTVRLLDSQTLQHFQTLDEHARRGSAVFSVAISPTAPQLATSDAKGHVMLWDLRHVGKGPLAERTHPSAVHSLAFVSGLCSSSSAEMLVTGGADRRLRVLETRTAGLACEGSATVVSALLCMAPTMAVDEAGAPTLRLATGGGSGGLVSDAGVTLWRLAGPPETNESVAEPSSSPEVATSSPGVASQTQHAGEDECEGAGAGTGHSKTGRVAETVAGSGHSKTGRVAETVAGTGHSKTGRVAETVAEKRRRRNVDEADEEMVCGICSS